MALGCSEVLFLGCVRSAAENAIRNKECFSCPCCCMQFGVRGRYTSVNELLIALYEHCVVNEVFGSVVVVVD